MVNSAAPLLGAENVPSDDVELDVRVREEPPTDPTLRAISVGCGQRVSGCPEVKLHIVALHQKGGVEVALVLKLTV